MKVSKRTVPLDMLSFEHKNYRVSVYQNRNTITMAVSKDGEELLMRHITPEQFISLLMRDAQP